MKTRSEKLNLTACGKDELERTDDFAKKVEAISNDVTRKYSQALLQEKRWIRRLIIKLRCEMEIRNRIQQLSSTKNLHVQSSL